ncbi:MAG: ABC transporter permease [Balneola sp.]
MRQFIKSISIALNNIRANPLHTFLSTLGIIIGVAAMVGILALGDGLEQTGREQIANTTSLNFISVSSKSTKTVDGIKVKIKNRAKLTATQALEIQTLFSGKALTDYTLTETGEVVYKDSLAGVYIQGSMNNRIHFSGDSLVVGRFISERDIIDNSNVTVLTYTIAKRLSSNMESLIGETIHVNDKELEVIGILQLSNAESQKIYVPISEFSDATDFPTLLIKSLKAEEIPELKEKLEAWLDDTFNAEGESFIVSTNEARVEQFSQGILMFKLIMGAITGISVLVGGIGVMNVLLISVTERTKEIGIRKAAGAKKKDIILQFMAESVTISFVGSFLGWLVGIIGVFTFVPIVNALTDLGNFKAAIGTSTVVLIMIIALFVGVVFGTYPAWRAAQLTPLDAIRHE